MAQFPVNFPIPSEAATASYDWTEIASGLGFISFYLVDSETSAGLTRTMQEVPRAQSTGLGLHEVKSVDGTVDFDLSPFNSPRTISGTAMFGGNMLSSGDYITVQVKKWDGTTETDISSAVSSQATLAQEDVLFAIDLTTTNFKTGDVLRVSLTTGGSNARFLIDPLGIEGAETRIDIPFKLDL